MIVDPNDYQTVDSSCGDMDGGKINVYRVNFEKI
jgi:hypothetical protein